MTVVGPEDPAGKPQVSVLRVTCPSASGATEIAESRAPPVKSRACHRGLVRCVGHRIIVGSQPWRQSLPEAGSHVCVLTSPRHFCFENRIHPRKGEVLAHCVSDLHFPDDL